MDKAELLELLRTDAEIRGAISDAIFGQIAAAVTADIRRRVRAGERGFIPPDAVGRR